MARDDTPATPAGLPYLLIYQYGWQTPQGEKADEGAVAAALIAFACAREDEDMDRSRPSNAICNRVFELVQNLC